MQKLLFCCFTFTAVNRVASTSTKKIFVRPGADIVLVCPKTTNDEVVEWLYRKNSDKNFITVSDNRTINTNLTSEHNFEIFENYSLQILNSTKSDEGIYKCLPINPTGPKLQTVDFILQLMAPPNVTISNTADNTIIAIENKPLELSCITEGGVPVGNITWQKQHAIPLTSSKNSTSLNYIFTPKRINNGDMYSCVVDHEMLTHSLNQTVEINVLYKPIVTVFVLPSHDIFEDQHAMLSCLSDGNPSAYETLWVKEGEQEIVASNATYFIDRAKKTHSGLYTCFAYSDIGNGSNQIYFVVNEKNRFPAKPPSQVLSVIKIYLISCCSAVVVVLIAMAVFSFHKSGRLSCKHCTQNVSRPAANQWTVYAETDVDNYMIVDF